jgi:L-cysteine:1D-myo-inositol 2-amino-2-deoxy-alpha-D-glucopyranoside ligase
MELNVLREEGWLRNSGNLFNRCSVKLYNTLSKRIETFSPRKDEISIYVCGITPYDTTHLGHAFTYTSVDILIRYLESKGKTVHYVQNVTDIDDDILRRAKEVGEDWLALGNRWTNHYIEDMQSLNVRAPDHFPRATDAIPEIIEWVQKLLETGIAYESAGSVYYAVNAWQTFGELSSIPRQEMLPIANERGNHPDDPAKRDPLDFVLWQAMSPGEPSWDSPWGPGRPGWHIECSTLSTKYLGETIDLHSGGADLCFPHHDCEIAQVEPVTKNHPFVKIWMHTAMVYHDGDKMSKSLGNLVWVRDLLKDYSADVLRFYMGKHHYREEWSYSKEDLKTAEEEVRLIKRALDLEEGQGQELSPEPALRDFERAMENDLDTPKATEVMVGLGGSILASGGMKVGEAQSALNEMVGIFGLRFGAELEEPVSERWKVHSGRFW